MKGLQFRKIIWGALLCASLPLQGADGKDGEKGASDEDSAVIYQDPPTAELMPDEKKKICERHEGKYIAFAGEVHLVKNCATYPISADDVYELTRKGAKIQEVDGKVLDALINRNGVAASEARPCSTFHKQYVTESFVEIYWVEDCTKRHFPDFASFEAHRGSLSNKTQKIMEVDWREMDALKSGPDMESVIDKAYEDTLKKDAPIEVLAIDEVCAGLIGQHVSYLGEIFFIAGVPDRKGHCQRKLVDAEKFTKEKAHRLENYSLLELSSTQALSIPYGKSMVEPQSD